MAGVKNLTGVGWYHVTVYRDAYRAITRRSALRKYGVPSLRSDLPAPRIRRVCDWTNYGDVPGVWAVINPSVFSEHGVYESDVLEPRSRQEVHSVFT